MVQFTSLLLATEGFWIGVTPEEYASPFFVGSALFGFVWWPVSSGAKGGRIAVVDNGKLLESDSFARELV